MDLYAMEILAHLEDFPVAQAVLVQAVEATESLSHVAIFFLLFILFFPLPFSSYLFSKREEKEYIGPKSKNDQ